MGYNIEKLIEDGDLVPYFQQIMSVNRKSVCGVEGLIRGINRESGELIAPSDLFDEAREQDMTLQLDRACRDKLMAAFREIFGEKTDKLLFLNVDASILDYVAGSNYLMEQVEKHGVDPCNIAIEVNETMVQGSASLKKFTDTYRKHGFLIALDDVGKGFSNMDRILLVRPDIIKIDLSLVRNIHLDYYKQGVFKSLVSLANEVGSLIVAEGVESEEEAIQLLRLGGHMMQGFFFARPQAAGSMDCVFSSQKIQLLGERFSEFNTRQIAEEQRKNRMLDACVVKAVKQFAELSSGAFHNKLMELVCVNPRIECAYLLDEFGVQISDTIRLMRDGDMKENRIFHSARMGSDHSMAKYYYPLMNKKLKKYMTDPYVSLATGNLCITVSHVFYSADQQKYILCVDFRDEDGDKVRRQRAPLTNTHELFRIDGKSIAEMNRLIEKMSEEIFKDGLTKVYNRRFIEERFLLEVYHTATHEKPLSIIMTDIDHFKRINDAYGHTIGDRVLKDFVQTIKGCIRSSTDWVARYGGEEFLIVLSGADGQIAYQVAEKIRKAVETARFQYEKHSVQLTASFGTYTVASPDVPYEEIMQRVDANLYLAKNSGRNRTVQ